jgi:3-hydroxyacyl-[acyl-carrier-protein] dehydratase
MLAVAEAAVRGMTFDEVRGVLAHRFPFLMIDKVTGFEPGRWIEAVKHISGNEICFLGHFPTRAVMPGVLIVEAMAQALSLLDRTGRDAGQPSAKYLGSVDVQFLRPVLPGDSLMLRVDLVRQVRMGVIGKASATVSGAEVARGEISLGTGSDGDL